MQLTKLILLAINYDVYFAISEPVIKFEKTKYSVKEPFEYGELAYVRIPVARYGDLSQTSVVRVHTKDGSAKAGRDYNRISKGISLHSHHESSHSLMETIWRVLLKQFVIWYSSANLI